MYDSITGLDPLKLLWLKMLLTHPTWMAVSIIIFLISYFQSDLIIVSEIKFCVIKHNRISLNIAVTNNNNSLLWMHLNLEKWFQIQILYYTTFSWIVVVISVWSSQLL